jgi:catechol 2,3-dioxygenase-like lactoylglutathione lyase family enzyme
VNIWYRVADLEAAEDFYKRTFGFEEVYKDEEDRWARMERNGLEIALAEGEFEGGGEGGEEEVIATLEVADIKSEAERLRDAGLNVGVVLEIPGTIRLLDVFDPDGNRIQLSEDV